MLLVLPATVASQQQQEDHPRVLPPHSVVAGKTLGEWSAIWWKWAVAFPVNDNPLLDLTGTKSKFGDVGPVFFLAGVFGHGSATRTVTIPANKFIFFPMVNFQNDNVGYGCTDPATPCKGRFTIDELYAQIDAIFTVTDLHASIDGHSVGELDELRAHRERAPVFSYTFQLTDNVYEAAGVTTADATGTVFPAVGDGYYLMLRPLPAGQHEIKFGGTVNGNSLDLTYKVTVTSKGSIQPVVTVP